MTDYDARLVDLYDGDNPDGPDHDFYRTLADELGASSILDLGCGTGILTVTFARPGRRVVGVDPSATMLAHASRRPGGDGVRWVLGDSRDVPPGPFDLAVMTGNVAQHIAEADWEQALRDVHRALAPGGVLAFESRNPAARAWERWAGEPTVRTTVHGPLREWFDVTELEGGAVRLTAHNVFESSGEHVVEEQVLTFRSREAIERSLTAAGFVVDAVWGDWDRGAWSADGPLVVVRAHRG
ncbi:methyltransferase type 11 [Cellulomonas chitinilytica]|uniref:Methyltransferase type 11 n=1 Tax=Cellulomonas chitinilytica TaxID=398759 RepID=A0A919P5I9_9CELL|nr:class I SAM-dependent methyltransferase [Cellulomonas chitinilytica]GIG23628.1 methyltransferase type 11 [Cellulomonas chitinilytica]